MGKFLKSIVNNRITQKTLKWFVSLFFKFYKKLKAIENPDEPNLIELKARLRKKKKVIRGPFKDMNYLFVENGSCIYQKMLGTYEAELHGIIQNMVSTNYTEILDVGCAEGYYVVGFALKNKNAKIFAYDIDEKWRKLCFDLAERNSVTDKIDIREKLTPENLEAFKFTGKNLIISDCEGYEKILFNKSNLKNLKKSDLLIEVHDFKDIEISTYLKDLFKRTHNIKSIFSIDDIHKAIQYNYPETDNLSLESKRRILGEGRATIMEWLICTPKN